MTMSMSEARNALKEMRAKYQCMGNQIIVGRKQVHQQVILLAKLLRKLSKLCWRLAAEKKK